MDLFNEIDDLSDLFLSEKNTKLDSAVEGYEDLQSRYSSLHEDYAKEIENSKKVEKCLIKCLKFYSKLSKKYEAQQKIISNLEQTVKEKIMCLEEMQRNEEKLKGLVQMYKTERAFYIGHCNSDLRKDKEILLDICCRLIGESVRNNNIRNLTNLLLRKFKKDLDDEKLNFLKKKKLKNEFEWHSFEDLKPDFCLKREGFKTEEKYSDELNEVEGRKGEEFDGGNAPLDLSVFEPAGEGNQGVKDCYGVTEENNVVGEISEDGSEIESSPYLKEEHRIIAPEIETCGFVNPTRERERFQETVTTPGKQSLDQETQNCDGETPHELYAAMIPGSESSSEDVIVNSTPRMSVPSVTTVSKSIFNLTHAWVNASDLKSENPRQEGDCLSSEIKHGNLTEEKEKSDQLPAKNDVHKNIFHVNDKSSEEEEVFRIVKEMSLIQLPPPVEEISDGSEKIEGIIRKGNGASSVKNESTQKRNLATQESFFRNKKLKPEEEKPSGGLLDSIMSAMSLQNEEFRSKGGESEGSEERVLKKEILELSRLPKKTYSRKKNLANGHSEVNSVVTRQSSRIHQSKQQTVESFVAEEIKNFVSLPMSCKEEADKNVKHCLSVLSSKPPEIIAKCVVATVLENVDEVVENFERPAPPLTKTQHRLIVLLSLFRTLDSSFEKISDSILALISQKLFPDNFFWPDDSLEAATRFYAALCRARNDPKTLWRFCLQAMTDMRQRCPLTVFTVLKTWPDVLYDAATLKNNPLAVTIVNIFLHMPKAEGLRNFNQSRKLLALKHLLMNFYQFKVEDTMEEYARKVLDAFRREEPGTEKSVVLLSKCRDAGWTVKHVLPALQSTLSEWSEGKVEDALGSKVLCVMKQICSVFMQEGVDEVKVREVVSCISEILSTGKKSHVSEVKLIEVLLQLKQYPEARKMIREWKPKSPIDDCLRNDIINASAENILRELKLNASKEKRAKSTFVRKKLKKQPKKFKGKKRKGKRRKSESRTQSVCVGVSS